MSTTFDDSDRADDQPVPDGRFTAPLDPPATGDITVAFLISPGTELVDLAGPWGVFEYVHLADGRNPFTLHTVAATTEPVRISAGMVLVPGHDLDSAPTPDIVVVPAMDTGKLAPGMLEWLRRVHHGTAVTMSVCNGSFVLAQAGLLDGRTATAHHGGYAALRATFPDVTVVRGRRYVEDGRIATAGGLTSGIDLALRIVERYFGRDVARQTATELEYQGTGWMHPSSNGQFAERPESSPGRPLCPVCEMAVSPDTSLAAEHDGVTWYFCGSWCERQFKEAPNRFVGAG
ncbi:DJ-1/PfpI family protein [Micromonospora sp. WMMD754]|uniref:DJ-1/PfpI family protein n=1 Tax=Micromonospora sp. WMMD754 TaxID=3404114 RepID=UPI003BF5911F